MGLFSFRENLKFEEKIELPVPPLSSHFGVSLEELMGAYGEKGGIPRVVRDCVTYLREYGGMVVPSTSVNVNLMTFRTGTHWSIPPVTVLSYPEAG